MTLKRIEPQSCAIQIVRYARAYYARIYAPQHEKQFETVLEALIKTVERRFCLYITKKQPIFRPTVFQGVTNMNKPNKERIANAPVRHYD